MGPWILILFVHVGPMGDGNSNALTNVPTFASEASCTIAGNKAKDLVKGTVKELSFVCVRAL